MNSSRRILRAAGTVGGATMLSRLLGFTRDVIIAWSFPPVVRDAFFVAFRLPNTMRRLFGEGAMVISFLPVFSEIVEDDPEEARRVFRICMALLTLALSVFVIVGIIFAPYIVRVFAPGFFDDMGKAGLTILLLRVMFPFLLLVSLVALAQGALNTLDHYLAPALAPSVLNIFMIGGAVWMSQLFEQHVMGLAVGVLAGGVAEVALQVPFLIKKGYAPRFEFNFGHRAVRRILFLIGPAAFGLLVYQFNMLVSTIFASLLPTGSVSWLFYAQRFTELPLGVFAVAIGTAILPTLSLHLAKNEKDGFLHSYVYGLKLVLFLMTPATLGLMALSLPIFSAFFQRGMFDYHESRMAALALLAYAPGLLAIAGTRVTAPAFYAGQDTKTPVIVAVHAFLINLFFSVVLMGPGYISGPIFKAAGVALHPGLITSLLMYKGLDHVGLALATSISAWYNFLALLVKLRGKTGPIGLKKISGSMWKTLVAGGLMVIPVWFIAYSGWADWARKGVNIDKALVLMGAALAGAAVFIAVSWALKQEELLELKDALARRFGLFR